MDTRKAHGLDRLVSTVGFANRTGQFDRLLATGEKLQRDSIPIPDHGPRLRHLRKVGIELPFFDLLRFAHRLDRPAGRRILLGELDPLVDGQTQLTLRQLDQLLPVLKQHPVFAGDAIQDGNILRNPQTLLTDLPLDLTNLAFERPGQSGAGALAFGGCLEACPIEEFPMVQRLKSRALRRSQHAPY